MMDAQTGMLSFDGGWSVGPGTDEATFAAASAGHAGRQRRSIAPYEHHVLRGVSLGGTPFNATLIFNAGQVESITLSLPARGQGWGSWSEADELQRKRDHDAWLQAQLGPPPAGMGPGGPYDFSWGTVSSNRHPQGGASTITVRYR